MMTAAQALCWDSGMGERGSLEEEVGEQAFI